MSKKRPIYAAAFRQQMIDLVRDGMTPPERDELKRLRRENKQLRIEREILAKAAAWFAQETKAGSKNGSGS